MLDMLFSTYYQTEKCVRSSACFGEPLKHVITLRGEMLVSSGVVGGRCCVCCRGAVAAIQNPVCPSKTSPCMPAPRAHVKNMCALGAGTHGDVLNVHTEAFLNPDTGVLQRFTPQHKTQDTQQPQQHTETWKEDGERRQRKREKRRRERR